MRKRLLSVFLLVAIIIVSFGCTEAFQYSIGCANIEANKGFTFFIVSDPHYISKDSYDNGKAFKDFLDSGDGKMLNYTDELFDSLIEDIETEKPDFLLITGDLVYLLCRGIMIYRILTRGNS